MKTFILAITLLLMTGLSLADGKAKYEVACVACHGKDGKLAANGSKDISNKTSDYILGKLKDYKAGKIQSPTAALMTPMVASLTDSEMKQIADYVASLK